MFELIKPNTKFDFMGRRKLFFAISGSFVAASILALLIFGLNRGIDFKGGTKIIVSFKADSDIARDDLKAAIDKMVQEQTGVGGSQVEVQDFDLSQSGEGEIETRKFQIYTEMTSLITQARKQELADALKKEFGEETLVELPDSGGDVFYISFSSQVPIAERTKAIQAVFGRAPFEYGPEQVQVVSERERSMDIEYIRELNLYSSELDATAEGEANLPEGLRRSVFEERKAEQLAKQTDARFTVTVEELKSKLTELLQERFGDSFVDVESSTSVSASVGADLLANGLLAVLYAIIGMLLYITLRFDMRYAPGAVVALIHDVSITMGIFAIIQMKFTLPIIAALLTIVGYSLNDTIVVFDRIRENVEKLRGRSFENIINKSINETLSRTILTSLTTLLVVLSILILGGGLIKDFAFALTIGIVVGTYSSVFIASPLALYLDQYFNARTAARKATR